MPFPAKHFHREYHRMGYLTESSPHRSDSQQVGDVKKSDLPGPEALSRPGRKEGQVLMVKAANGSVEAHQVTKWPLCHPLCLVAKTIDLSLVDIRVVAKDR